MVSRQLERLLQGRPSVDWSESRRWCSDCLRPLIAASPDTRRLTALLAGREFIVGGDEHHLIRVESDPQRVYKLTYGDNFGCTYYFSRHDPEHAGKHFHGTGNADPFFYLRRWRILNLLSGYHTRFEGFLPPERPGWLPRICVSQPRIRGENPSVADIRAAFGRYDFREISQDAYLHPNTAVLLTDAAPRNVRIVDGVPIPFDAIACFAPSAVLEWVASSFAGIGTAN